jgi:alkylation response protein AidB-like acyl-CoA dehydrogenase
MEQLTGAVASIADRWAGERSERQARRHLERADFDELRDAGLLLAAVPDDLGGTWLDVTSSTRPVCELYRRLATGDPSVALVSSMHPAVISYWLATPGDGTAGSAAEWEAQRRAVFESAAAGEQWGTITSEPGSGGDIAKTRSIAAPTDAQPFLPGRAYGVTGDKHFGSGSGLTDRMMTTALPEGSDEPTIFVLDVRDRPWDGSAGLRLVAEWDGMGMAATQSHAMRLEGTPAVRLAWDGGLDEITRGATPFIACLFTAVILGVLDEAVRTARGQIAGKAAAGGGAAVGGSLRAFEQVEWSRAEQDHWLAQQAYEGGLRAVESGEPARALHGALRAKEAVAELAEATLSRLTRVLGGGTFSQRSPFSHWFEDVRALGFLRPPWGLAFDVLFTTSLEPGIDT